MELPGNDHLPFVGDQASIIEPIERMLAGLHAPVESNRMLATVLCASSRTGGDSASMERVTSTVAFEAARFGGTGVQQEGDHVFAIFDGPARAIRCGCAIETTARQAGIRITVGLHTGECDLVAGAATGLVADISTRIAALGEAAVVLVSRTVVNLVAGSGLRFHDQGSHQLVEGMHEWRVFAVEE